MLYGRQLLAKKLAERVTPLHDMEAAEANAAYVAASGTHHHGEWCGDAFEEGDEEGPRTISPGAEKGWKKLIREFVRQQRADSGEFPRDLQAPDAPNADGTSERPVHDPVVPYEDRPEDDVQSMPFMSTAPAECKVMEATRGPGKAPRPTAPPAPRSRGFGAPDEGGFSRPDFSGIRSGELHDGANSRPALFHRPAIHHPHPGQRERVDKQRDRHLSRHVEQGEPD